MCVESVALIVAFKASDGSKFLEVGRNTNLTLS